MKTATAYDSPSGETYVIVIPQVLYVGDNQMWRFRLIVGDVPRPFVPKPNHCSLNLYT
jgi:hypothetical protein